MRFFSREPRKEGRGGEEEKATGWMGVGAGAKEEGGEEKGPAAPKTGLPELDDNPGLFDFMFHTLDRAVREVKETGSLTPFAVLDTLLSGEMIQGFPAARLELGYEEARGAVLAAPAEAERYALAWAGYVTQDGVRYEAILVGGGERGMERGAAIGQRYKQQPGVNYQQIGNPMILGPSDNLLTLSGDPDALSKLKPVFTRLTADMAHNQGPGYDEALAYEIRRCQEVILDFGDLDRPFVKELQKKPDMVHVVMGGNSWITTFGPEDKEVVLVRETLVPVNEGQPFPGFVEDGMITVGYSPPESALRADPESLRLLVLWIAEFKVIDKEN